MSKVPEFKIVMPSIGYGHPDLRNFYHPHEPVIAEVGGPSMTRQEFAEECDINVIMARYEKTGVWPLPPNGQEPTYLNCEDVPDLMTAMRFLHEAESAFMKLPAKVRREFDNDPVQFVAFAEDAGNLEQMREWGLAPPAPAAAPEAVSAALGPLPAPGGPSSPASSPGAPTPGPSGGTVSS